ncbi:MAG: beta-lactamase family protein [Verrucomicrobia bacterium]|nr:beta-lactamase family protein [Verrucomicrobiota bacterium]
MSRPRLQLTKDGRVTRRRFLAALGAAALGSQPPAARAAAAEPDRSVATAFDREMREFMRPRRIPGGALAVVKDRRLVYARGYGWADRDEQIPVQTTSRFRIASLSKPITAVAVLRLAELDKLHLETRVLDLLSLPPVIEPDAKVDPRWAAITVRQLLHHTAGFDTRKTPDPMFRSREIAHIVGVPCPPAPRDIVRYMLGRPLDFDPGTAHAYSNFGYCVLGRVIEAASGTPYETWVREHVLAPMGIRLMQLGASLAERRAPGEVRYYMPQYASPTPFQKHTAASVFGDATRRVPRPYGGFCLESMDAHGGWIASVLDLARFAAALDNPRRCPVLNPGSLRTMYDPPPPPVTRTRLGQLEDAYYAAGWMVRPVAGSRSANYWHTGSLPGTFALLVRRWDGLSWAVLFNQRSTDIQLPDAAIDRALHRAADSVRDWPQTDGFAPP